MNAPIGSGPVVLCLAELKPGRRARIQRIDAEPGDADMLRLMELGFVPGQDVRCIKCAPLGDPLEVRIMHYNLCIRKSEAAKIYVETI